MSRKDPLVQADATSSGGATARGFESLSHPKIAFLAASDPRSPKRWSGTVNAIFLALQRQDPNIAFATGGPVEFLGRGMRKLFHLVGFNLELGFSRPFARLAGCWASLRLAALHADAVVAVAASSYVAFLKTRKPIIYISDTTFAAIVRLYPEFQQLPAWLQRHGDDLERRSLLRAAHVIYPSEWAKRSAIADYGVDAAIVHVMPFGPNLSKETIECFTTLKVADFTAPIRILWVAVDWVRKNGDLVLEVGRLLRRAGYRCELFLVGSIPASVESGDHVHVIGPLNKTNESDLLRLCRLYEAAHFLFLPTTADASPVVFSEAQAFGCPAITYDVGGTSTAILDNETGIVLPLTARAEDFARRIAQLVENRTEYERLSLNARRRYEQTANWDAWAQTIRRIVSDRLDIGA